MGSCPHTSVQTRGMYGATREPPAEATVTMTGRRSFIERAMLVGCCSWEARGAGRTWAREKVGNPHAFHSGVPRS